MEHDQRTSIPVTLLYIPMIATVIFLLFLPYFKWLLVKWKDNPWESFGYIAPFISFGLIFFQRKKLRNTELSEKGQKRWSFLITGICLAILFRWSRLYIIASVSLPLVLYGISSVILGGSLARNMFGPVFLMLFIYPWGDLLNQVFGFQLRHFSVFLSYIFFKVIGLSGADINGTFLFTGRFLIDIAPACSGLTMLNVLIFMCASASFISEDKIINRIIIIISVIPVAVMLNTLRIALTGIAGHFFGEGTALGFYHSLSGIIVFGLAMLILYLESILLPRIRPKTLTLINQ